MTMIEIFLVGVGLAMDAFAVSICKGLLIKKITLKDSVVIALWFGLFQGVMPLVGYLFGRIFEEVVNSIDHWIAFILLVFIGINMIRESFNKSDNLNKMDFKTMFLLAVATSVDALAVGVTFAFFDVNIVFSSLMIALITFILSIIGVIIGNRFGDKFQSKAELFGGIILICLGFKILLEHLGILF